MGKTIFDIAREYEREGKLKSAVLGDFRLFCYSRDTFYSKDGWDFITKSHRGALYYKGIPVNNPMTKIFNLNEQEETSYESVLNKMESTKYEVYDKANGHLLIVSCFVDDENQQQVMFHTKASLPNDENELLVADINLFLEKHGNQLAALCSEMPVGTYMFEAIVEHDKHTLYEQQCEQYEIDKNGFILLSASIMVEDYDHELKWFDCDYEALTMLSKSFGSKLVKRYDLMDSDLMDWLNHKGVEGYVIKFLDGSRVKIKTKEYWQIRFKKDLNAEKIVRMFNTAGFDRIRNRLPEEIAEQMVVVLSEYFADWYNNHYIRISELQEYLSIDPNDQEKRKELSNNELLTSAQKIYIFSKLNDKSIDFTGSKHVRTDFVREMFCNKELMEKLQSKIDRIVSEM